MLQATSALQSFVAANLQAVVFDLYTLSLPGISLLRFTSAALAQTIPATNFPGSPLNFSGSGTRTFAVGPLFERSKIAVKIGTEPAEVDITVHPRSSDLIGSFTWQKAVENGFFDGATVELDRFYAPAGQDGIRGALNTSLGAVVWFYGQAAEIENGRSTVTIKAKSMLNLLTQQQMPRRLYQAACTHAFGDAMCGYDRVGGNNALGSSTGLGAQNVTAAGGSTVSQIVAGFSPSPANQYDQGTLIGLTGANPGISRAISQVSGGNILLRVPFPTVPVPGDTFQALPGCDHTVATCNGPLNNFGRYGGMPYIPPPELAL